MWTVTLLLGLRHSDSCGLRWTVWTSTPTPCASPAVHCVNALTALPTKTQRSTRTVPLPALCVRALTHYRDAHYQLRADQGPAWVDPGYLFTTGHGTALEPRNLIRDFRRLCEHHGLRRSGYTRYVTPA